MTALRILGLRPVVWGQILSLTAPVVAMVGLHLSWMPTAASKARMALKHVGFWGGMGASAFVGHRYGMWKFGSRRPWLSAATFVAAATFPMVGYALSKPLGRRWFPELPKSVPEQPWSGLAPTPFETRPFKAPSFSVVSAPSTTTSASGWSVAGGVPSALGPVALPHQLGQPIVNSSGTWVANPNTVVRMPLAIPSPVSWPTLSRL